MLKVGCVAQLFPHATDNAASPPRKLRRVVGAMRNVMGSCPLPQRRGCNRNAEGQLPRKPRICSCLGRRSMSRASPHLLATAHCVTLGTPPAVAEKSASVRKPQQSIRESKAVSARELLRLATAPATSCHWSTSALLSLTVYRE